MYMLYCYIDIYSPVQRLTTMLLLAVTESERRHNWNNDQNNFD